MKEVNLFKKNNNKSNYYLNQLNFIFNCYFPDIDSSNSINEERVTYNFKSRMIII